ncbi:MAG: response regulator [Methanotrichaceae archaeon]
MIKPYHILIIEDDPNDIELIRLGFEKNDEFFLDFSTTGEEGLELASEHSYDLISLDFALPDISGLDVLERIRERDQYVPVVMVTGRDREDLQVVAFQKHATSYVAKSVESFRSLPHVFEALIKEAKFRSTERQMKNEVTRSEMVSRYILENSPVGIYVLQDGCFKLANPKFGDIFECQIDDLIGKPFWSAVDPENFECINEVLQEADGRAVHKFKVCRSDGSRCWIEAQIILVDYQDERWVFGNLVDVTRRQERENELLKRNQELTALYNITKKTTNIHAPIETVLDEILSDVMIGLEGTDVSGVFLLEDGHLVLRSLHGSLEKLIEFVDDTSTKIFLEQPRLYKDGTYFWASAPINCKSIPYGLLVVGSLEVIEEHTIQFLKKMAQSIGCIVTLVQSHSYSLEPSPNMNESLKCSDVTCDGDQNHNPS